MPSIYKVHDYLYHAQAAATSTRSSSHVHASSAYLYYDYNAVRDRRSRTTRTGTADAPAALYQLMDTNEAMNDVHIYTTTTIMHGERGAKTEDDNHISLIGGAPASESCGGN